MQGVLFYRIPDLRNKAQLRVLITQIDAIILELMETAMKSVLTGNHAEYELDTGATRTKVKYTSMSSISKAVEDFRRLRQMAVNELQGTTGMVRLMDEKNFRRRC